MKSYMPEKIYEPEEACMPKPCYKPATYYKPEMYCMSAMPCIPQETVLWNVKLARAYVPFEKLCKTYPPIEGLEKGTIFPELYSPYAEEDKKCIPCKYE